MYESGGHRTGKARQGSDVKRNESLNRIRRLLNEAARLRDPRVINKNAYPQVVAKTSFDSGQITRLREIRRQNIDRNSIFLSQTFCQEIKFCLVASDQHKVVAPAREPLGVNRANTRRSACNED
ncbi:hypothetical protein B194_3350 [Serratia plymuthica A30]|nr:hypothetical protein B194_3350 [Serratia plymuthica A30]